MNLLRRLFKISLFLSLTASALHAQEEEYAIIKGHVTDEITKEPIYDAIVSIKGTNDAVNTDSTGYYELRTKAKPPFILNINYEGYQLKDIEVYEVEPELNVPLRVGANSLSTVVIVGYGTQDRNNLTSAISTIQTEDVKQIPVAGFNEQIQGKAAGVQINSNTGTPGDGVFVRVRGTTSINSSSDPLYIVDGVFLNNTSLQTVNTGGRSTSPIADINPADIESIEVLKDATATAIYGSRGANGVIIVTTKRGDYNAKPKIDLNVSQGWVEADKSKLWKLASGPESAALVNENWINSGIDNPKLNQNYANRPFRPTNEVINGVAGRGTPEEQPTISRLDDVLRKGKIQNYDLSASGGSKSTKYFLSLGYTHQESIVNLPYFNRASFKANLDQKITDKITIGTSNSFSRSYRNQARAGDGPTGNLFNSSLSSATYTPKYDANGNSVGADNTYLLMENYDVNTVSLRYIGNIYAEVAFTKDLKLRSSLSVDYDNYKEHEYWNSLTRLGAAPTNGLATSALTENSTWINEQTLSYRKQIGKKHNFGALLGNSSQSDVIDRTSAEGRGFANNTYTLISSAATRTSSQAWTKASIASFFSRVDYNYDGKYFIEGTIRADGSSKFGANHKWGYFPSIGVAWRLKKENFLSNVDFLSDLKLRVSYGITGNQSGINNFAAQGLWSGGAGYADVASADQPGIAPQQLGNPDLKWEKTQQSNLGIDIGLIKNKINIELNLYNKYTSDILLQTPLPSRTGFTSYFTNSGEISNKGYEIGINTVNISNKNLKWQSSFNISGNVNKIEKLPSPITAYARDWVRLQEGYPMYSFWLYEQLSVNPQTGAPVFAGQNDDGSVTSDARKILGNGSPKFFGGLTNTLTYKGFDFSLLFTYQYGNKALHLNRMFRERGNIDAGIFANLLNRWQKPGDVTDVPRLTSVGNNYNIEQNSRFLEDASFIRLKSFTVGYTLPKTLSTKAKLEGVRIYFVATNLLLWTKFSGPDPESNVTSNQNIQGLSFGTPPQPRGFQFGLKLTL